MGFGVNNSGFTIDIPPFYCYVKAEYLYNLEAHHGETIPCFVFGADSVLGRAVGFDLMLDNGAMFARLPVSSLVHKTDAPDIPLDHLQLWSNFSSTFEAYEFTAIRGINCEVLLKDKVWYSGSYLFTFSWFGSNFAEDSGEGGFKRAVMVKLDNGCYALQPYNRMRFHEASFVTKPWPKNPDYKTNSHNWTVEDGKKWATEDSDKYFYNLNLKENEVKIAVNPEIPEPCRYHNHPMIRCDGCHNIPSSLNWNYHAMCYNCGSCEYLGCTKYHA